MILLIVFACLLGAFAILSALSNILNIESEVSYEELMIMDIDGDVLAAIKDGTLMFHAGKFAKRFRHEKNQKERGRIFRLIMEVVINHIAALNNFIRSIVFRRDDKHHSRFVTLITVETTCILC